MGDEALWKFMQDLAKCSNTKVNLPCGDSAQSLVQGIGCQVLVEEPSKDIVADGHERVRCLLAKETEEELEPCSPNSMESLACAVLSSMDLQQVLAERMLQAPWSVQRLLWAARCLLHIGWQARPTDCRSKL